MKYLPWISMVLVSSSLIVACGDDADDDDGGSGGTTSSGASSGQGGSVSAGASAGASAGGTGGTSGATAGNAGSGGATGGGGAGGSATQELDIVDTAVAAGSFKQLAAALTSAGLVEALKGDGPFTVFAPNDAAFERFETENPGVLASLTTEQLTAVLKYHVVAGAAVESSALKDDQVFVTLNGSPVLVDLTGGVKVAEADVTTPDVMASNGVIHVIDTIILPPADDVVATAVAAGNFTQLAGALTAAGLVETLKGPGPFTVFAPTDAAFNALAAVPEGDALRDVLLYHVVSGAVGSGNLTAGAVPTLLTGKSLTVALAGGVTINGAAVTAANIITKNGVIHVVDAVLVP